MRLRTLLFVPGDRADRFSKAAESGADAIILDLEDSVSTANKEAARAAVADYLSGERQIPTMVRVNPLDGHMIEADIIAIAGSLPDAIILPKAEGAPSVAQLDRVLRQECPKEGSLPLILPIATETPAAIFTLGSYREVKNRLIGLTWGAEDLPAAIGAVTSRQNDGSYTPPYEIARALTLFAAHGCGVAAIDTVFPAISDQAGLADYAARARRDGFTGMMAIHPSQVALINVAFTPSEEDVERAQTIVHAFAAHPGVGALQIDGKMIDAPHLKQALQILTSAGLIS